MKKKSKQIAAMTAVILLISLYLATLVLSFLDFPYSDRLFQASLAATIGVPILLWIYMWLFQRIKRDRKLPEEKEE